MDYKVEKNVPLPSDLGDGTSTIRKYPFNMMEVGDSFFFNGAVKRDNVDQAASYYGKRHGGMRFSTRREGDGYRCWRVA